MRLFNTYALDTVLSRGAFGQRNGNRLILGELAGIAEAGSTSTSTLPTILSPHNHYVSTTCLRLLQSTVQVPVTLLLHTVSRTLLIKVQYSVLSDRTLRADVLPF